MSSGSVKAALAANAAVATAKAVGTVFTGSASMAAEAIHSLADCGNQLLLMWGMKSSERDPDVDHPLGYGMNVFFWSFVVALVLFSVGGVYSVWEGVHKLSETEPVKHVGWALGILLFGVAVEGKSFLICVKEIKAMHPGKSLAWFVKETRSPELLIVFGENLAALVGLALAAIFLGLAAATGNPAYDAVGSIAVGVLLIAVGVLLIAVAGLLFWETKALLIGQSVDPSVRRALREHIFEHCDQIEHTYECLTLQTGKSAVLLLRVRMDEKEDARKLLEDIDAVERSIAQKFPQFEKIFIEPDSKPEDF